MAAQPLTNDDERSTRLHSFSLESEEASGRSDAPQYSSASVYTTDDDEWPPTIGSSRTGKWWYSTFHNVTAMVGAGVLGLPYAMRYLHWGFGTVALVASWVITLYTLWQMVEMHEMKPGKRFDRYHELGQEAFGPKLGLWMVMPLNLVVEIGTDIVYMVTGGQSLYKIHKQARCPKADKDCRLRLGQIPFIIFFAVPHFFLAQLPTFNSITGLSLAAAVMSVSYSTIAWSDTLRERHQVEKQDPTSNTTTSNSVFHAFEALGIIAFAYAGHNVVLEIQSTLPSTERKPSKRPMWRGVVLAYGIVALCYFPVALIGYWVYGDRLINQNILLALDRPSWLIIMANLMVMIHVTGGYQLYAMPVFDMMEIILTTEFPLRRTTQLKIVTRSLYVFLTAFVACALPFFSDLMAFFGGLALAPTTYYLPCLIWLRVTKPKRWSLGWTINWIIIVLGVLLSVVAMIGSFRNIVVKVSNYSLFKAPVNVTDR